ncbi:MAG: NADH-ubiquinone oxidoreductase-F iron-sulfur binding region domain-containing protein [Spirochaetales bacterium]|nr:NADH-ubiquinone oxidoreductase-F iron-sulfur binding region domain-containing protein [Spirochaetales bacterium]
MKNNIHRVDLIFHDLDIEKSLEKIQNTTAETILEELKLSGLRGRGGAGFPTGLKWESVAHRNSREKYVICNADEGEPGTFKDREILQKKAEKVFLGMAVCSHTIKATKGYIYLRAEYGYLLPQLNQQIHRFNGELESLDFPFNIELRLGSGAYVCGEETSLIESLEGKRGEARNKPPFPVESGFLGKPTIVNNVETLVYTAHIALDGGEFFRDMGTDLSTGAKVFCVSGDTEKPGIYELELGMTLADFNDQYGCEDIKAVQVGGVAGYCVPRKNFKNTIIGYEGIPTGGSMMLFNSSRSMYRILHNYLEFFLEESCGQCTPCRIGCQQLLKGIEMIKKGQKPAAYLDELQELAETMQLTSKCGLGQSVVHPFNSITTHFREEICY